MKFKICIKNSTLCHLVTKIYTASKSVLEEKGGWKILFAWIFIAQTKMWQEIFYDKTVISILRMLPILLIESNYISRLSKLRTFSLAAEIHFMLEIGDSYDWHTTCNNFHVEKATKSTPRINFQSRYHSKTSTERTNQIIVQSG